MKRKLQYCLFLILSLFYSCSTTRVLSKDEYRLAKNKVYITNNSKFNTSEVEKYIKQQPNTYFVFGWNPFLNIYNWANPKKKGGLSKFFRTIGQAPVIYDENLVKSSEDNIKRHLEYIGYYNSLVNTKINKNNKIVKVSYIITLGKQYPIKKITYSLPKRGSFKKDFLKDTINTLIKPGDILSEKLLEQESERSSKHFRELGYYGFNKNYYFFIADTLLYPSKATLELKINEYTRNETNKEASVIKKYSFGNVNIFYPKSLKFKSNVLRKLNLIHPQDPYSEGLVNITYNRLSAIRIFSSVNIELTQVDSNIVDCNINLTPSKLQGFKTNLEVSSNSTGLIGISPGLSYYNKNIFRGGEWLNLGFTGNFQFQPHKDVKSTELGISNSIIFPKFLFLPYTLFKRTIPRTEVKIAYNYQNRPEYKRNIVSTSFGYLGYHKKLYYQFYPLQLNIVKLYHIDSKFYSSLSNNPFMKNSYQNHFDLGTGLNLYYTNNTDVNPKTSYYYGRLQIDVAGNSLSLLKPIMKKDKQGNGLMWGSPFSQYIRGELTLGKTWRFGRNNREGLAARFLIGAGYAYGNSSVLPFEQHFYGGGASSLRGWQARNVGPGLAKPDTLFIIPNQTGDMKIEANLEYRFNMFWKLAGAIFLDAGNVWTYHKTNNKLNNNRLGRLTWNNFGESIAANWGLGLRMDLNFILLRIDMGIKLHDPSKDYGHRWRGLKSWFKNDGYSVHLGVGYPF